MDLKDKRVVVLGGTSGIGLAVAQAVARDGADVIVASSRPDRVEAALANLPGGAVGRVIDLTQEGAVRDAFAQIGSFDHLVYTAGEALQIGLLSELPIDTARRFFNLRYWGAVMAAKYASPAIRAGGSIVFTSGIAGTRAPQPGWALGTSVCAAMEGLTRALAVEIAPIRVNIVSPGFVRTPLWDGIPQVEREAMYADAGAKLPVGRVGEAAEVAEAYLFLMRQDFATGQALVVDGGGLMV